MRVLVLGATGATGKLVVQQLIKRNIEVKIVARKVPQEIKNLLSRGRLECIIGHVSEFGISNFKNMIEDCDAVISCLGHNITFKGMFGNPRMLVTDCIKNVCSAISECKNDKMKLILMNTTANRNIKIKENYLLKERMIFSILWFFLPPHKDNVEAAKYLSKNIGEFNPLIEWIAVRPDSLIDEETNSKCEIYESPIRSPIFDAGQTSRINVAHFMTELLCDESLWNKWKFRMPVIYNTGL